MTNNIGHQQMVPIGERGPAYVLPHLLNRDAGGPPVRGRADHRRRLGQRRRGGAGAAGPSTSTPSRSTRSSTRSAAPTIPTAPTTTHGSSIHLDDGRSFVRKTDRTYDLIVYALVDSLVLHSGYSSLRLESFLFTEQAFRDVKARLKPGGVFVMYNYYRQGWVVGRLATMAEKVFGTTPIVISLPYQERDHARPEPVGRSSRSCSSATDSTRPSSAIRATLDARRVVLGRTSRPRHNDGGQRLRARAAAGARAPTPEHWQKIGPAAVDTRGHRPARRPTTGRSSTSASRRSPRSTSAGWPDRGGPLAGDPVRCSPRCATVRPNGQMFFLGAGFMLLETKGVVHMALLFGSTWVVNSIVFFAILVMILLSNLYVLAVQPARLWPYYALLVAALAGQRRRCRWPTFLALPGAAQVVASCAVIFVPVFFAGVIFAAVVPRQPAARRRLRLEHRRRDPRRPEREPLAGRRLQPPLCWSPSPSTCSRPC